MIAVARNFFKSLMRVFIPSDNVRGYTQRGAPLVSECLTNPYSQFFPEEKEPGGEVRWGLLFINGRNARRMAIISKPLTILGHHINDDIVIDGTEGVQIKLLYDGKSLQFMDSGTEFHVNGYPVKAPKVSDFDLCEWMGVFFICVELKRFI